jgi:transposase-like protein
MIGWPYIGAKAMTLPKIYTDDTAARKHLEALQWPDGPLCPHCGVIDQATLLQGKSTRPGVYKCRACEKPFSVTVGTLFEDSKVPLHKWLYAVHLLTASKKGISSHQLHRMLGVTYKTAWFMSHRIRESMRPAELTPMGGTGKVVEVDETFSGFQEGANSKTQRWGSQFRNCVFTLVERFRPQLPCGRNDPRHSPAHHPREYQPRKQPDERSSKLVQKRRQGIHQSRDSRTRGP